MDLNEFVGYYKIQNKGPDNNGMEDELKYIQDYLRDVPVSFEDFNAELKRMNADIEDLMTSVELYEPGNGGMCVFDSGELSEVEVEEIGSKIRMPFPLILIGKDNLPEFTPKGYRELMRRIVPEKDHYFDVRVLTSPQFKVSIGIVHEKGEEIDYIELCLVDSIF